MAGLREGLGFEELPGATGEDVGSKISQLWITGSIKTDSELVVLGSAQVGGSISGASHLVAEYVYSTADISGAGIIYGDQVTDTSGLLQSIVSNSGTQFTINTPTCGAWVQHGVVETPAGSEEILLFDQKFTNGSDYSITFSPRDSATVASVTTSGLRTDSGVTVIGAASTKYDWIAIGR